MIDIFQESYSEGFIYKLTVNKQSCQFQFSNNTWKYDIDLTDYWIRVFSSCWKFIYENDYLDSLEDDFHQLWNFLKRHIDPNSICYPALINYVNELFLFKKSYFSSSDWIARNSLISKYPNYLNGIIIPSKEKGYREYKLFPPRYDVKIYDDNGYVGYLCIDYDEQYPFYDFVLQKALMCEYKEKELFKIGNYKRR